jgi:MFS transporter, putative metabolite transport protein
MSSEFDTSKKVAREGLVGASPASVSRPGGQVSSTAPPGYETRSDAFKRRFMWRLIIVLTGGMLLDGYILGVVGPVTPTLQRELGLNATEIGLVAAAALLGILIGSPLGGWATDKWGRKPLFMMDISLFVVASLLQFFAGSAEVLILIRFLMGIAIGAEYSVGWPMMSEFAPAKLRGRLMATVNLAWYSGFMIGYTVAYFLSLPSVAVPWRWILGSSTIIAIALLLGRLGLPESPRWLWNKGRTEQAMQVAHKYLQEVADIGHETVQKKANFSELFSRRYVRATVFVSWFWFCNVLPYFGIATFADEVLKQYGLSGGLAGGVGLSLVAVFGVAVTMALIDKAGRRVFTVPQQWIALGIFLLLGFWAHAPAPLVLGLFLVFSFVNAMNGVLTSVYPGEVFPTEVRGIGTGFAAAVSRLGAAAGTFLLPVGIASLGIAPVLLVLAAVVASGAIVSQLWAPETKGKSLSETAAGFSH